MPLPLLAKSFTVTPNLKVATVAGGCFWGVEHIYRKYYIDKGVIDVAVGYANGKTQDPTYKEVCSGETNHAEAVQVLYDPAKVSYQSLIEFFLRIHDPTQLNFQGPDRGTQYRSAIFVNNDEEKAAAQKAIEVVQAKYFAGNKIVTSVETLQSFWDAETYHQNYLVKNPEGYECPTHFLRGGPAL